MRANTCRLLGLGAAITVVVAGARLAHAESFHERAAIKPLLERGEVVGVRLTLTLRGSDRFAERVRVGLVPLATSEPDSLETFRAQATDPAQGYLLHQWPELALVGAEVGKPRKLALDVRFADAPRLRPGSRVVVLSAWNNATPGPFDYWHIWGRHEAGDDPASVLEVPATGAAARATPPRPRLTPRTPATSARRRSPALAATRAAPRARR